MNWTEEQLEAINTIDRDRNVLVSAGAGGGKTAVLTERAARLLINKKATIDELLILTFTKAAAYTMKSRIVKKLIDANKLELANRVEGANIATFDAYALSLVKKYAVKLNISRDARIIDEAIMEIKSREIIREIFAERYASNDPEFVFLITKYAKKKDDGILETVVNISKSADLKKDAEAYLNNFVANYIKLTENARAIAANDLLSNQDKLNELAKLLKCDPQAFEKIKQPFNFAADNNAVRATKELIDLTQEYRKRIAAFKKERNCFTYADIAKMALSLVKDPDINKEIKSRLKYIMVDEYQDTSDIQDELITSLSDNNVFVVGDVKQSIYRFRNANPKIFQQKEADYAQEKGGKLIVLDVNYRSRKDLLEDVDALFSKIMRDDDGGVAYRAIKFGNAAYENEGKFPPDHPQDGRFEKIIYPRGKTVTPIQSDIHIEATVVAQDIVKKITEEYLVYDENINKLRPCRFNDFVVLTPKKKTFAEFAKVFGKTGIPLKIVDDKTLRGNEIWYFLTCLINFVVVYNTPNWEKDTALKEKAKHYWVGVARNFVFAKDDKFIYEALKNTTWKQKGNEIFDCLAAFAAQARVAPLAQFIRDIVFALDLNTKILALKPVVDYKLILDNIVAYAEQMEEMGYGIEEFARYLEEMDKKEYDVAADLKENDEENVVRIMTMHKSKGMEFPIIYQTNLKNFARGKAIKGASNYAIVNDVALDLPLIDYDPSKVDNAVKKVAAYNNNRDDLWERIRLLYVALTRAKEKNIILVAEEEVKKTKNNTNAEIDPIASVKRYDRFIAIGERRGFKIRRREITDLKTIGNAQLSTLKTSSPATSVRLTLEEPLPFAATKKATRASKIAARSVDKEALELGNRLHFLLEQCDFETKDVSWIIDPSDRAIIQKVLELPLFENVKNENVYKEYAYVDEDANGLFSVDLFIDRGTYIDLIDYKARDINDKAYVNQLGIYAAYLAKTFQKEIRGYLISVLNAEIKKVF